MTTAGGEGSARRGLRRAPVFSRPVGIVGLAMTTVACAQDAGSAKTAGWVARDSSGVTVISNQQRSESPGCIRIDSTPQTVITSGVRDTDQAPPLFQVWGAAVLSGGQIAILNAGSHQILFFSQEGDLDQSVGRQGNGPGEFRNPQWLGHGLGDTLFVWDAGLARLSTFDGTGALLDSRRVSFDGTASPSADITGRFADGSFLTGPGHLVFLTGSEGISRLPETYYRYDPKTDRTTHLADGLGREIVVAEGRTRSLPFGKRTFVVAHGNSLIVADNGLSAIRSYDLGGKLQRVIKWRADPIPVTAADRSNHAEYMATEFPDFEFISNSPYAEYRPRFSSIRVDRAGWIWIAGFTTWWEPPASWLVFDETGVLQCEVDAPAMMTVLEIGTDYVLGRQRTPLGEESVVLYRIRRQGG